MIGEVAAHFEYCTKGNLQVVIVLLHSLVALQEFEFNVAPFKMVLRF